MKKLPIPRRPFVQRNIVLVFVAMLLSMTLFAILITINNRDTRGREQMVNHTYKMSRQAEGIYAALAENEYAQKVWQTSGDTQWLKALTDSRHRLLAVIDQTHGMAIDPAQQKRLDTLRQMMAATEQQQDLISYDGTTIQPLLHRFMQRQDELLLERTAASEKAKKKYTLSIIGGATLLFLFITGTLIRLNNDIRRRKLAEDEIKKSEHKYRRLIEDAGVTLFTANREGLFTYVNEHCQRLTGFSQEELIGTHFTSLLLPTWFGQITAIYVQQIRDESADLTIEFPIQTKTGQVKWVEQHSVILHDEQNNPIGYQCLVKDITQKREQEQQVREYDLKVRAMLKSSTDGFYMLDRDMRIIMINEAAQRVLRILSGQEAVEGDNMLKFVRPERKNIFQSTFDSVLAGNKEEVETRMDSPEGEKWFNVNYFPVIGENNNVLAVCISSKDITERKLTDKALEKIRAEREEYQFRLQSILDNTPMIVFVKDLKGRYLLINQSFREAFKLTDAQVIGKTDFEFANAREAEHYKKADEEVIRTQQSIEKEETINTGGEERNLLLVKFPLFDKNNTIYGVGGIATDYTSEVKYRYRLIEAKKKAESAEQLQEQFLANMSHEIRTPMNGIIGMTNVLANTALTEDQKEFVQIIRQSSDNLLVLINDILDLSKIKAGKLSLEQTAFSLHTVLDTTLAPFYLRAKEKKIALTFDYDSSIPAVLNGDPYRLTQVLNNLLSNALKFTEEGSVTLSVKKMEHNESETRLLFSVADTGSGIPSDKQQSIFNSFEQANESITRKHGGTGLGLAITKKLVEMQHGSIQLNSEPGRGSVFSFVIPYSISESLIKETADTSVAGQSLAGKRILVAEDNIVNQKVIGYFLKKHSIEATIVNNGKEAVDLLESGNEYDLVILDLRMPVMDGLQTAAYIRQKLKLRLPMFAMTANSLRNEEAKCIELGINEYIMKPFVHAEVLEKLCHYLSAENSGTVILARSTPASGELYNLANVYEMDDHQYTCEILELFLKTIPSALARLKEVVLHEDWTAVQNEAHKMKSSFGILQMKQMLERAASIEHKARERKNTDDIPGDLKIIIEQFDLVQPMISAELASAKALIA